MRRILALLLVLCLCVGLCACSEEEVPKPTQITTVPTTSIEELLHNRIIDLINAGDFLQASILLHENPEINDYTELMKQCGKGVLSQYIQENGSKKEAGKFFLNLVNSDGTQISIWYYSQQNTLEFLYYSSGYGSSDALTVNYPIGTNRMTFSRSTMNWGSPTNYQEGHIDLNTYTGISSGNMADNNPEPLVIPGLTVTKAQSIYNEQTKGYCNATKNYINEMLNALFNAVIDAGYKGTIRDIGFMVYDAE